MHVAKRRLGRLGVVAGAMALSFGLFSGIAQAATYPYDGENPETTGCASDATTMESAQVVNEEGVDLGVIELRYSLTCHAGWARLTLNGTQGACGTAAAGYACPGAMEVRNNDGKEETCTITQGETQCYTDMLYDLNMTSYAEAHFDTPGGTGTTRTAAY